MKRILSALAFSAAAALAGSAQAQRVAIPESGRVRITATGHPRVVGDVTRLTADTVTIRGRDSLVALPRDQVRLVEVPDGRRRYLGTGLAAGFGIGAVIGGTLGALCHDDCPEGTVALTTFLGGAGGMILGAGIGAMITGDIWRDADAPRDAATVTVAPERRGVRLAVRLPSP
ncbi:MAG TPA: hypothetical protein VF092_03455 [Longimicrobium sp.]